MTAVKHKRTSPVLVARGVTKIYHMEEVHALRGIYLDLMEGEMLVILCPSGSGGNRAKPEEIFR